ncbi:MAG: hypothetical protein ABIK84_02535 [candidate division WOR-3 bacterium]
MAKIKDCPRDAMPKNTIYLALTKEKENDLNDKTTKMWFLKSNFWLGLVARYLGRWQSGGCVSLVLGKRL